MGKHTEAFNKEFYSKKVTFAQAESFVMRLSEKTTEMVIAKIIAKTKKTWTSNVDIYKFCKENNIVEDYDPYDNYDTPDLFTKVPELVIDYTTYKTMDDIKFKGRDGFVITNDTEAKKMIIEFEDTELMETINYSNDK
jgi:hypothetical protein